MSPADDPILAGKFRELMRRYSGATAEGFVDILCPILIPIRTLDASIIRLPGQSHHRASFTVEVTQASRSVLRRGRTGKFVPGDFGNTGNLWREIAKGRIVEVDWDAGVASGEIYTGARRTDLERALTSLTTHDLLEIDQYGAAAKVLSGLAEHALVKRLEGQGLVVSRMPEDMARHLGSYANYDFEVSRRGDVRKVEVKSLWGTNVRYARLIHSTTTPPAGTPETWSPEQVRNYYPTSSCKFETQDIFAVSLFLRTGSISDFAFARSVSRSQYGCGLPPTAAFPNHVNQNPLCEIGDGSWFPEIDDVWNLP